MEIQRCREGRSEKEKQSIESTMSRKLREERFPAAFTVRNKGAEMEKSSLVRELLP